MTETTTPSAIVAAGLRKSYGDLVVLDGIDLTVPVGTVLALLGPNGAGKTTMVRILSTLLAPDSGTATVLGHDLAGQAAQIRGRIGVTGQFSAVDGLLTARENLRLVGDLHRMSPSTTRDRATRLLERLDLTEAADRRAAGYSAGMRRRLDLAMTLLPEPALIFLDEPTTGLDPRSRRALWRLVQELVDDGTTVVLTTQDLQEADRLADRITVLDRGRIVAEGTPAQLKRRVAGGHVELGFASPEHLDDALGLLPGAFADTAALTLRLPTEGDLAGLQASLATVAAAGVAIVHLTVHTPDLDDVFLALTGAPAVAA